MPRLIANRRAFFFSSFQTFKRSISETTLERVSGLLGSLSILSQKEQPKGDTWTFSKYCSALHCTAVFGLVLCSLLQVLNWICGTASVFDSSCRPLDAISLDKMKHLFWHGYCSDFTNSIAEINGIIPFLPLFLVIWEPDFFRERKGRSCFSSFDIICTCCVSIWNLVWLEVC